MLQCNLYGLLCFHNRQLIHLIGGRNGRTDSHMEPAMNLALKRRLPAANTVILDVFAQFIKKFLARTWCRYRQLLALLLFHFKKYPHLRIESITYSYISRNKGLSCRPIFPPNKKGDRRRKIV